MKLRQITNKLRVRYTMIKSHPLAGKKPLAAIIRYIKFNCIQTINPKPRVYKWVRGLKFFAEKGDAGIVGNIYYRLMDFEESMFVLDNLNSNDLFVDIGANIGHYTLLAAGGVKAKVIAVEPIKTTFEKLDKNVKLNNLETNVKLLNVGLSNEAGALYFENDKGVMNKVSTVNNDNTITVEVITLNTLLKTKNPTFIKIDVEGYEYFVLKGGNAILERDSLKYLMVEFNNSGNIYGISDDEVYELILRYNFIPVRYNVNQKKLEPMQGYNTSKFNTLFAKKNLILQ